MTPLAELFGEGDYRFHLTLRRGDPREFFGQRDATGQTLAERARWLAADPERYAALQPEGEPLLEEWSALTAEWGVAPSPTVYALGTQFEPDVLLLSRDADGNFRLRGGALCFPTGWALAEKIGLPLEAIHGVVPGLNPALASPIQQFLTRLKPGTAFLRDNWGIAATDERNLHPARQLPPPNSPVALDRLWLRVEHQALVALPRTRGIVFGIRVVSHRLDRMQEDAAATAGLKRALASMPAGLAAYKRVEAIRDDLIRLL